MNKRRTWCIAAVFSVVLLLTAVTAHAQSFIAPPESLPGGLSYQQWSAKWWQWVWSTPLFVNPLFDTTGLDCAVYQSRSGPVWHDWFRRHAQLHRSGRKNDLLPNH